jgi:hypothetical protein
MSEMCENKEQRFWVRNQACRQMLSCFIASPPASSLGSTTTSASNNPHCQPCQCVSEAQALSTPSQRSLKSAISSSKFHSQAKTINEKKAPSKIVQSKNCAGQLSAPNCYQSTLGGAIQGAQVGSHRPDHEQPRQLKDVNYEWIRR